MMAPNTKVFMNHKTIWVILEDVAYSGTDINVAYDKLVRYVEAMVQTSGDVDKSIEEVYKS